MQLKTKPYQVLAGKTLERDVVEELLKIEYLKRMGPQVNGNVISQGYLDAARVTE